MRQMLRKLKKGPLIPAAGTVENCKTKWVAHR